MGSKPVGISASRGAAVLGESEYQTTYEIWQRLKEEREPGWNAAHGMIAPPEVDNAAVRWGTAFEDSIVELAEAARGEKIVSREEFWSVNGFGDEPHFERRQGAELANFITCHIDGSYFMTQSQTSHVKLHEGKTTTAWAFRSMWGEPETDRVPRGYQIQTQHQMLCTGAETVILSALVFPDSPDNWEKMGLTIGRWPETQWGDSAEFVVRGPRKEGARSYPWTDWCADWAEMFAHQGNFHQYIIPANRDLQKLLVDGYTDFWQRYIIGDAEPDITRYSDILRAFPEPVGTIVLTEQEERWMSEYRDIKAEISPGGKWGKRCDELKITFLKAIRGRIGAAVLDDESKEKLVFRNATGAKLGQYSIKAGFRIQAEKE